MDEPGLLGKTRSMRMSDLDASIHLTASVHGVLSTVHPQRGVDAVPVVFAVDDADHIAIPIDLVKPKAAGRLRRELNLEIDPRATLLVDHWDRDDWSRLWWVRVELRYEATVGPDHWGDLAARLAARYPQYRDQPFDRLLVLRIIGLTGWAGDG